MGLCIAHVYDLLQFWRKNGRTIGVRLIRIAPLDFITPSFDLCLSLLSDCFEVAILREQASVPAEHNGRKKQEQGRGIE